MYSPGAIRRNRAKRRRAVTVNLILHTPKREPINVNKLIRHIEMWESNANLANKNLKWVTNNILRYCAEHCLDAVVECKNCPLQYRGTGTPEHRL